MFKYANYIYEIYKEQSFTKAAKKLYISQPSLSATLRKAEDELGFKIFNRETSPVTLTDEGKFYVSAIEDIYRIENNLKDRINSIHSLVVGDISVSGAAFISSFILPKVIMEFSKMYPKINIQLIENNSINLQEKLLSEEIELLIDYDFDSENFESFPLKKEYILLAVSKQHPINTQFGNIALSATDIICEKHLDEETPCVDLGKFKQEKFIQLKPKNNMYKMSCDICSDYGFVPQPVISVDQLLTAYNIAGSGMGITFTTDTVIQSAAKYEDLLFYKFNSSHAERILYIAHKKKKCISPAVAEFINVARKIYANRNCYTKMSPEQK